MCGARLRVLCVPALQHSMIQSHNFFFFFFTVTPWCVYVHRIQSLFVTSTVQDMGYVCSFRSSSSSLCIYSTREVGSVVNSTVLSFYSTVYKFTPHNFFDCLL